VDIIEIEFVFCYFVEHWPKDGYTCWCCLGRVRINYSVGLVYPWIIPINRSINTYIHTSSSRINLKSQQKKVKKTLLFPVGMFFFFFFCKKIITWACYWIFLVLKKFDILVLYLFVLCFESHWKNIEEERKHD